MIRRVAVPLSVLLLCSCESPRQNVKLQVDAAPPQPTETDAQELIAQHVQQRKDKERAWQLAYWEATISGKPEDFEKATRLELEYRKIFQDKKTFKRLKWFKDNTSRIVDDVLIRQLRMLYLQYLENQVDPKLQEEMVRKGSEIEQIFYTFRAKVDGKTLTANDVLDVLRTEKNSARRKKVWEASKEVGPLVAPKLIELVKLRNRAAKSVGFANYYDFMLAVKEIDPKVLSETIEDLSKETDAAWIKLKAEIDSRLAKRWRIKPAAMRPWHYEDPFFQEAPHVVDVSLDKYYKGKDPKELVNNTYHDLGIDIRDILERSDLYEKPGKLQHAYCTDIDRQGDVRVLANLRPNEYWTGTMLHEMAHAIYDKSYKADLPYVLREPAHAITTEAAAMFFEDWKYNPDWIERYLGVSEKERARLEKPLAELMRIGKLSFMRWGLVMVSFEHELYRDPDQDLNKLWWDLVEKYQLVKRPEGRNQPDWATKVHFVLAPVYYQNYVIANLFVSMLKHRILIDVLRHTNPDANCFVGRGDVGDYFVGKIFMQGAMWHWAQMVVAAGGEPLTVKFFVDEYVNPTPEEPAVKEAAAKDAPAKPEEKKK